MPSSTIKKWAAEHKYFEPREGTSNVSNFLMDNGKLYIPENQYYNFLKEYAKQIDNNEPNYICEVKTPIYKLFFDLDFVNPKEMEKKDIIKYCQDIHKVIKEFYPEEYFNGKSNVKTSYRAMICVSDSKEIKIDGIDYIKNGIHLIFPKIIINNDKGQALRSAIIQYLESKYGLRPSHNIWEDVVDRRVFESNGLRMVGSNKIIDCKYCNKDTVMCSVCLDTKKLDEGRSYKLLSCLTETGDLWRNYTEENKITLTLLKNTSIRVSENLIKKANIIVIPFKEKLPEWYDETYYEYVPKIKNKVKIYPLGTKRSVEDEKGASKLNLQTQINENDCKWTKIVKFLRQVMPDVYKTTHILDLHECEDGAYYVARTDSKFCMNISREHNSNTIYFLINQYGAYQKCFCQCEKFKGRKFGLCREYSSKLRPLTKEIKKLLFPKFYNESDNSIMPLNTFKYLIESKDNKTEYTKRKGVYIANTERFLNDLNDVASNKIGYEKRFNDKRNPKKINK